MTKGACELKSAQFSLMRLAIYQTDANAIQGFVADQVSAAPELLDGAPVALDFLACGAAVDAEFIEDIVSRLRYAGMQPIAVVAELDSTHAAMAKSLRLGVVAPLKRSGKVKPEILAPSNTSRSNTAPDNNGSNNSGPGNTGSNNVGPNDVGPNDANLRKTEAVANVAATNSARLDSSQHAAPESPVVLPVKAAPAESLAEWPEKPLRETNIQPAMPATPSSQLESSTRVPLAVQRYEGQVRSGQQLYAKSRDLIVTGAAGAGSEVIADGSIHIYGRLMGKVIAGASGDRTARIYCLSFGPELVSIAGIFRVFESISSDLMGKSVQIWLDGDKLRFDILN